MPGAGDGRSTQHATLQAIRLIAHPVLIEEKEQVFHLDKRQPRSPPHQDELLAFQRAIPIAVQQLELILQVLKLRV
jgi:hypothetical protein